MVNIAGFKMKTDTHENKKAGKLPNASNMYEYSAPDLVISVPNSA